MSAVCAGIVCSCVSESVTGNEAGCVVGSLEMLSQGPSPLRPVKLSCLGFGISVSLEAVPDGGHHVIKTVFGGRYKVQDERTPNPVASLCRSLCLQPSDLYHWRWAVTMRLRVPRVTWGVGRTPGPQESPSRGVSRCTRWRDRTTGHRRWLVRALLCRGRPRLPARRRLGCAVAGHADRHPLTQDGRGAQQVRGSQQRTDTQSCEVLGGQQGPRPRPPGA